MASGEEAALRALPVALDELADLLEGGDDVRFGLVDLRTGAVHPYSEMLGEYLGLGEGFDPDEDPDRWLVVHRVGSRAAYEDMVAFIEQVSDPGLQDRLEIAISGRGAFRRFKDVLARDPTELQRFFAFTNDRKRERAREWLAEELPAHRAVGAARCAGWRGFPCRRRVRSAATPPGSGEMPYRRVGLWGSSPGGGPAKISPKAAMGWS